MARDGLQKMPVLVRFLGEYETFKADPAANFVHDSAGHAIFRQYRRMNLNAVSFSMSRSGTQAQKRSLHGTSWFFQMMHAH